MAFGWKTPTVLGDMKNTIGVTDGGSGYKRMDLIQILGGNSSQCAIVFFASAYEGTVTLLFPAANPSGTIGVMYNEESAAPTEAWSGYGSGLTVNFDAYFPVESNYAPSTSWGPTTSIGILEPSFTGVTAPEEIEFPDEVLISDLSGTEITVSDIF